jgi:hypothetical protein
MRSTTIRLPRLPRASRATRILLTALLAALIWIRIQVTDSADAAISTDEVPAARPHSSVIDGVFAEWEGSQAAVRSDGAYVYVRFQIPEERTLQGGNATTRVLFDLDADSATGQVRKDDDGPMGVDLEVTFSPPNPRRGGAPGHRRLGPTVHREGPRELDRPRARRSAVRAVVRVEGLRTAALAQRGPESGHRRSVPKRHEARVPRDHARTGREKSSLAPPGSKGRCHRWRRRPRSPPPRRPSVAPTACAS